jgi:hypothetical protein
MKVAFSQSSKRSSIALLLPLLLGSCNTAPITDAVQQAVNAIDHATDQLHDESTNWQSTLTNLESGLDKDAKDLIDNDVQNLLNQTITRAGIETRCEGNFLNDTVSEDLLALKAKLLKQPAPARHPEFCQVDPTLIDVLPQTPTSSLQFAGYNFDSTQPFDVKVHHADGSETSLPPNSVAMPTSYLTTIGLASANLSATDALYIYWKGTLFHTVGVFTPAQHVCQTKQVDPTKINVDPVAFSTAIGPYYPPQVVNGADKDFDGHGPMISLSAKLSYTPQLVQVQVYMDARETQKDYTEVQGWSPPTPIFTAEQGFQIDSIAPPMTDSPPPYIDNHNGTTNNPFPLRRGGDALVAKYAVVGDQSGDDVGRASVTVFLNKPMIFERETGNCLSPTALAQFIASNRMSPALADAFRSKLAANSALVHDALLKRGR